MHPLFETLPLPQRLALAYAPRRLRPQTLGLLALDAHLAGLVRRAREPLLGQARLAWWRERLEEPSDRRPAGEPVLALMDTWKGRETALVPLVDGWEHLLAETLEAPAIAAFAEGRGTAFATLAALVGADAQAEAAARAGRRWALADLAEHLDKPGERAAVLAAADELGLRRLALPRALRPLAMLDGLARLSLARGGTPLLAGPRSAFTAVRLGIVGR